MLVSKMCDLFMLISLLICSNLFNFKVKLFKNTMARNKLFSFSLARDELFSVNLARRLEKLFTPGIGDSITDKML